MNLDNSRLSSRLYRCALVLCWCLASQCKTRPADLREWQPSDHTQEDNTNNNAQRTPAQSAPSENNSQSENPQENRQRLMMMAGEIYISQCANCHGPRGNGDGPQPLATRPPSFSDQEWQRSRTDEQLRESIANGKNLMPGFGQTMPPEAVDLMVTFVRAIGRRAARGP